MTTATEPLIDEPSIGVAELPALDQPDERECELVHAIFGRCGQPAAWAATGRCPTPDCMPPLRRLICDPCRLDVADGRPMHCRRCYVTVVVTSMEPL